MLDELFSIKCHAYGQTDIGKVRDHNEDNIRLNQQHNLFILADGMGGHDAGEVASLIAADKIEKTLIQSSNQLELDQLIIKSIKDANRYIHHENRKKGTVDGKGMGTTIVGCWFMQKKQQALIFNVGDSRAYSYYKEKMIQISTDHSLLQLWKDGLLKKQKKPAANSLTKALGPYEKVVPDVMTHQIKKGEKILLCSDGLTTMLSDKEISDILHDNEHSTENISQQLIDKANDAGGEDNISVILIDFN